MTTTSVASRRGSLLETWRLFGDSALVWMVPLALSSFAIALLFVRTPGAYFAVMGVWVGVWLTLSTVGFEQAFADRLAFMTVVPQPVGSKWLVIVPNSAAAALTAGFVAMFGRLPAMSALPLLGCALWTIGSVRLIRHRAEVLVLPALALAPVASWSAFHAGGWGAASAVALALGLGAMAFQPAVRFDSTSSSRPARAPRVGGRAPARQAPVSSAGPGTATWLVSAARYLLISTAELRRLKVAIFAVMVVVTATQTIPGMALFMWVLFAPRSAVSEAFSAERKEFLCPRPFSRSRHFVGSLLLPLVVALLIPVLITFVVDLDWINRGSVVARLLHRSNDHDSALQYLRDILGARFLPEKWPAGGLTQEMWLRVRPLLWLDLLRMTAIVAGSLFAAAHVRRTGLTSATALALQLLALGSAIRLSLPRVLDRVPVPPLWFAAALAVASVAHWAWYASRESPTATGSSTSG